MKVGLLRFGRAHRERVRAEARFRRLKRETLQAIDNVQTMLQTLALAATPLPQDGVGH